MSLFSEQTSTFLEVGTAKIGDLKGSLEVSRGQTTITSLAAGATQLITLDKKIPAGAVIINVILNVVAVAVDAEVTDTLALSAVTAGDLIAATNIDTGSTVWNALGQKKAAAVGTTPVRSTGISSLQLTAAGTDPFTAGQFQFSVIYIV
jgi:hypothetical protein